MRHFIPSWIRVPVVFFIIIGLVEYFVDSGDKPAFIEEPIVMLFLLLVLLILIAIEAIVEAMNNMVNMMREHTTESTRIHYVITKGGEAPNVVPDFAEVYYYARHSTRKEVVNVFDRIVNAAKGAALGTGTSMEYEMIGGTHELLHNEILQKIVHKHLGEHIFD